MVGFVLLAVTMTVLAFVVALQPLWRHKRASGIVSIMLLSLLTGALYAAIGTPSALHPTQVSTRLTMDQAIARLRADLQRDPSQIKGWRLLGRAYVEQNQLLQARDAYARAAQLSPTNDDVQVEYAEARALADPQRRFDNEASARLKNTLLRNPQHQRARWFLGIAQRQAGQTAQAIATWEPLLAQVADANTAAALRQQIDDARREAGLPPSTVTSGAASSTPDSGVSSHVLTIKVALDPEFAARVRLHPEAAVFVIARVPDGPKMPVAVEKHNAKELPLTVTLDDSDSPMPMQRLSALQQVEVLAKLSDTGSALPADGGVESAPVRVAFPIAKPIELSIGARH